MTECCSYLPTYLILALVISYNCYRLLQKCINVGLLYINPKSTVLHRVKSAAKF